MTATARKPKWTLDQWTDFGRRCRAAKDRLSRYIGDFPMTLGLTGRQLGRLIMAHNQLLNAMIHAEDVMERQHPAVIGHTHPIFFPDGARAWEPWKGRAPRTAPILSRERWAELGAELKAIRADVRALLDDFWTTRHVNAPNIDRFLKAERTLDVAKCRLDDLVFRQHPDWHHAGRCFYGPHDPDGVPP